MTVRCEGSLVVDRGSPSPRTRFPFWFGGLACSIATVATHPQDLIKVRLQTRSASLTSGTLNTAVKILKVEGLSALYSGLSASLLRQMTYSTVRFGTYDLIKYHLRRPDGTLPFSSLVVAAVAAGCIGGGVGNPADIVNIRMQNDGQLPTHLRRNYRNAVDGLYQITRLEGPRALFRGLRTSMSRSVVMTVAQLGSYDVIKRTLTPMLPGSGDSLTTHFACSLLAGIVATTACSPLDVVKTRIMNASKGGDPTLPKTRLGCTPGIFQSLTYIVRTEGVPALFKGWVPSYLRLGPHTIITFMALEQFRSLYMAQTVPTHSLEAS